MLCVRPAYRASMNCRSSRKCAAIWPLVVAQDVAVEQVLAGIRSTAGEFLTKLNLFDVYVGKGIDPDRKSLALGLTWQHPSRTLTDEEINDSVSSVLAHLPREPGSNAEGLA